MCHELFPGGTIIDHRPLLYVLLGYTDLLFLDLEHTVVTRWFYLGRSTIYDTVTQWCSPYLETGSLFHSAQHRCPLTQLAGQVNAVLLKIYTVHIVRLNTEKGG